MCLQPKDTRSGLHADCVRADLVDQEFQCSLGVCLILREFRGERYREETSQSDFRDERVSRGEVVRLTESARPPGKL